MQKGLERLRRFSEGINVFLMSVMARALGDPYAKTFQESILHNAQIEVSEQMLDSKVGNKGQKNKLV